MADSDSYILGKREGEAWPNALWSFAEISLEEWCAEIETKSWSLQVKSASLLAPAGFSFMGWDIKGTEICSPITEVPINKVP
jgi:hypothetical protein